MGGMQRAAFTKLTSPLRRVPPEELASVHSNILGSLCPGLGLAY